MHAFSTELLGHFYEVQTNNTDFIRFAALYSSAGKRFRHWFREKIENFASGRNYIYVDRSFLAFVLGQIEGFESFYNLLQDESSRRLMVMLLAFKVLGNQRVKLPTNNPRYWEYVQMIKRLLKESHTIPIQSLDGYLNYYELEEINFPIRLHAHAVNILCTFLLQQYRYEKNDRVIEVEPGDVIIDAGSCWGDTTLYFAHKTGTSGKVYGFEFSPDNLVILEKNLGLNRPLKERIQVIPEALWLKSGETLPYIEKSSGTRLTMDQIQTLRVRTKSIDDFVEEQGLERIDFIKMDIEGAELKALEGAKQTIRKFKPKLAIALYHKHDDFVVIPQYLDSLDVGYEFFLGHSTIHKEETVLFACHKKHLEDSACR